MRDLAHLLVSNSAFHLAILADHRADVLFPTWVTSPSICFIHESISFVQCGTSREVGSTAILVRCSSTFGARPSSRRNASLRLIAIAETQVHFLVPRLCLGTPVRSQAEPGT